MKKVGTFRGYPLRALRPRQLLAACTPAQQRPDLMSCAIFTTYLPYLHKLQRYDMYSQTRLIPVTSPHGLPSL